LIGSNVKKSDPREKHDYHYGWNCSPQIQMLLNSELPLKQQPGNSFANNVSQLAKFISSLNNSDLWGIFIGGKAPQFPLDLICGLAWLSPSLSFLSAQASNLGLYPKRRL
jgi:hypothetical protein